MHKPVWGQGQELRAPSGSPTWVAGLQALKLYAASQDAHWQAAEQETEVGSATKALGTGCTHAKCQLLQLYNIFPESLPFSQLNPYLLSA